MAPLLTRAVVLLLNFVVILQANPLVEVTASNVTGSGSVENDQCVCKVYTGWSEMAEYDTLKDMRARLAEAETLLQLMNFTSIFDTLENATARLAMLEDNINKQAVAASVTELFALRKKVEALVDVVEQVDNSSSVHQQKTKVTKELETISQAVDSIWSRNPYQQRDGYKQEVAKLRDRFSRCQKTVDFPSFAGDSLPLNISSSDVTGWCLKTSKLKVGSPVTHHWEEDSSDQKGMWFKDPRPKTNTSRTEIWKVLYKSKQVQTRDRYHNRRYETKSFGSVKSFPKYTSLITDEQFRSIAEKEMRGYGAVVYQNSLYYNDNEDNLIKLDLSTQITSSVKMSFQNVNYRQSTGSTYLDLNVDESGLFVIYSMSSDNKLAISKIDPETLLIKMTWMTDIIKTDICAAFMICGKMYTVKSCNTRLSATMPNYVYDTQTASGSYGMFHVPSKYGSILQLTYNPRERVLFGWDKGHLITYPLKWETED